MDKLYIINGNDAKSMTAYLLEAIKPETGLDRSAKIALKPNLVVAKNWKSGATTNPAVCEAVIEYFFERGFNNLSVIESSWLGCDTQYAYKNCGYTELSRKYGIELVDVKKDNYITREYGGMNIKISKRALETDFLINLPLIKGHCQTKMTCALKNMKGVISDSDKRRFHSMGLHKPIAYLNKMIYPSLTIADGIYTDPGFEQGGNPRQMDVMIAGRDSVLIDSYAAKLLGFKAFDIEYIRLAEEIGVGSADISKAQLIHIGEGAPEMQYKQAGDLEEIKSHIDEYEACSACYANLVQALIEMGKEQSLDGLNVCVGQGFKGKSGDVGSGNCTAGFKHCVKGCPPDSEYIIKELTALRRNG